MDIELSFICLRRTWLVDKVTGTIPIKSYTIVFTADDHLGIGPAVARYMAEYMLKAKSLDEHQSCYTAYVDIIKYLREETFKTDCVNEISTRFFTIKFRAL
jgi:hypothetical protein